MTDPRFYLVVDLEATTSDDGSMPPEQMETIEIGAVVVNAATLEPVDEYQSFIRPVRHPRLLPFCTRLTSITQAMVERAPLFPDAFAALQAKLAGCYPSSSPRGAATTGFNSSVTASCTAFRFTSPHTGT
jgi:inhibitor of KinA sporulation pathway (predicted exonuclease)